MLNLIAILVRLIYVICNFDSFNFFSSYFYLSRF